MLIDAERLHVDRATYAAGLVKAAVARHETVTEVAGLLGVSRQYLHQILSLAKVPSYSVQFCLEYINGGHDYLQLNIDARQYYQRKHTPILVERAIRSAGGVSRLARRAGVTEQFINKLQRNKRQCRYPFHVLLSAIATTSC